MQHSWPNACAAHLPNVAHLPNIAHLVKCRAFHQLVRCAVHLGKYAARHAQIGQMRLTALTDATVYGGPLLMGQAMLNYAGDVGNAGDGITQDAEVWRCVNMKRV